MIGVFFITASVNYAYNISMGWLLPPDQYGVLGVSTSILLILSLFVTTAFPLTVTKFLSEKTDIDVKYRVFKSALAGNVFTGMVVSALFYLAFVSGLVKLGENYRVFVLVIVLAVLASSVVTVYQNVLQAYFRFKEFGAVGVVNVVTKFLGAVSLVLMGLGAFGALLALPLASVASLLLTLYFVRDFRFWQTHRWADTRVFFFALPIFFGTVSMTLLMNLDILGVKFLTDFTEADRLSGYYRSAIIIAELPVFLSGALMGVMFPYISREVESRGKYISKTLKYAIIFMLPVSLVLALIPRAVITLAFPEEYAAGAAALGVVAIGMGFLVLVTVLSGVFQAVHQPRIPAIVLVTAVILDLTALLVLVPRFGLVGAATSTTLASATAAILLSLIYIRTYSPKLKFQARFLSALTLFGFLVLLLPHSSRLLTLLNLGVSGSVYLLFLMIFGILTEEDVGILLSGITDNSRVGSKVLGLVKTLSERAK